MLYGAFSNVDLLKTSAATQPLPLSALGAAFLLGIGGAKSLTAAADQANLKTAAVQLAAKPGSNDVVRQISAANPAEMVRVAAAIPMTDSTPPKLAAPAKDVVQEDNLDQDLLGCIEALSPAGASVSYLTGRQRKSVDPVI